MLVWWLKAASPHHLHHSKAADGAPRALAIDFAAPMSGSSVAAAAHLMTVAS